MSKTEEGGFPPPPMNAAILIAWLCPSPSLLPRSDDDDRELELLSTRASSGSMSGSNKSAAGGLES